MKILINALLLILCTIQTACSDESTRLASTNDDYKPNGFDVSNSIIPIDEIYHGGPSKDGIPSIDQPKFIKPAAVDYLKNNDMLISYTVNSETKAYPLRILVWHEIVNDQIGETKIAVTYCPLCGTAMIFDRTYEGKTLTFGVSGLLYNSDVLMFDRQTESLWTQLGMQSISGKLVKTKLNWLNGEMMNWQSWKEKFSNGQVLSTETGYNRNYAQTAYAGYEKQPDPMFPVKISRNDLSNKDWVIGFFIDNKPVAISIKELPNNKIQKKIFEQNITVINNSDNKFIEVINADKNQQLPVVHTYWFAWQAFYPDTILLEP